MSWKHDRRNNVDRTVQQEFAFHQQEEPYFEGWYIKTVTANLTLAVIFGISKTKESTYGFIQTNDTLTGSYYETFELEELHLENQTEGTINFGKNQLTQQMLSLDLKNGCQCQLSFTNHVPLQSTWFQPTIMGPFSYMKQMECIHAIVSLHHQSTGTIQIQGVSYDGEGIGYMEKDRGVSFPSQYRWFQSNHCEETQASMFLSIARIPFMKMKFTGCICILMIQGKQQRFATYLGCRTYPTSDVNKLILKQYPYKIIVEVQPEKAHSLYAPKLGELKFRIQESLTSKAIVSLYRYQKPIGVYHFTNGGYEHHEEG